MQQDQTESAALRQELAAAQRRNESLRQMIESISGELALEPLLTRIVASAAELIGAQYGSIGLVVEQPGGPVVRIAAIHNMPPQELGAEIAPGVGLAGRVLQMRRPIWLERYGDLPQPMLPALAEHAVIGVPIWRGEQMIGVFGIGAEPPRRFSAEDAATLGLLARHAAIAIKNARRYEGEQHRAIRLATINRIGQLISSSLSLKHVFQTAVEAIHLDLGFSYVAAGLVDPDDPEWLVLYAHIGADGARVPDDYRHSIHEGVVGTVARTRQRVLINNVAADQRYLPLLQDQPIYAELALPILADDQLLGVLNIEAERPITAEDVEGVAIIAAQLGTAVQNARRYEQELRRTARLELIARIGQRLTAHRDPQDILSTTVAELHGQLGYDDVALLLRDPDDPEWLVLRAWASRWPQPAVSGERRPIGQGLRGAAVRQRAPALSNDLRDEPEQAAPELRAALAVPILLGEQVLGVLDLRSVKPLRADDLTGLQIIADQLATVLDNQRQQRLLYERGQQLAVIEERQRLARELHDSVTQLLFSMTLIAQSIAPGWQHDPATGQQRVARLLELSQQAHVEMRALLGELRPPEQAAETPADSRRPVLPSSMLIQQAGLPAALRRHLDGLGRDSGLRTDFAALRYRRQPPDCEAALFRIAQEALHNIVKHARAQTVTVRLAAADKTIGLWIHDDGVGFCPGDAQHPRRPGSGLGLRSMRERAAALGGSLTLQTGPGGGTTIEVQVPRHDEEC